jgi:hypothetical protein
MYRNGGTSNLDEVSLWLSPIILCHKYKIAPPSGTKRWFVHEASGSLPRIAGDKNARLHIIELVSHRFLRSSPVTDTVVFTPVMPRGFPANRCADMVCV